ncbi:MAG: hypothetical protein ACXVPU_05350 [Bacteroidia bacterium]
MKKNLFLFLLFIGLSTAGFSQAAGKGSGEKSGSSKRKAHAQMRHFDKAPKDPNMKHNGTSYRRRQKSNVKVDGDGFSNSSGSGRKRRRNKSS